MPHSKLKKNDALDKLEINHVRVHFNSQPARISAMGFFAGKDIHVKPKPEEHLPHELSHSVQQGTGRVRPKFK